MVVTHRVIKIVGLFLIEMSTFVLGKYEIYPPRIIPQTFINNTIQPLLSEWKHGIVIDLKNETNNIVLICRATYPTQWKLTGFLSSLKFIRYLWAKRNFKNLPFVLAILIDLRSARSFKDSGMSLRASCEALWNPQVSHEFYVFAFSNKNKTLVQNDVAQSNVIPCPTLSPMEGPVDLYHTSITGEENQIDADLFQYDPTVGFKTRFTLEGFFTCRQNFSNVSFNTVSSQSVKTQGIRFSPRSDSVQVSAKDTVNLECLSEEGEDVQMIFSKSNTTQINVMYISFGEFAVAQVSAEIPDNMFSASVNATCFVNFTASNVGKLTVVKEWNIEFFMTPILYLDNYNKSIICVSPYAPVQLEVISCRLPMDCNLKITQCMNHKTRCTNYITKVSSDTDYCEYNGETRGPCAKLSYRNLILQSVHHGFATCTVNGLTQSLELYESLDGNRYSHWMDASHEELVRIKASIPDSYASNMTARFICEAVGYLFADSLYFEIQFRNGSRCIFNDLENSKILTDIIKHEDVIREAQNLYKVVRILDLELPEEATWMHCTAPFWNSTEVFVASKLLETF